MGNCVVNRYLITNFVIGNITAVTTLEVAVVLNGAAVGDGGIAVPRAAFTNGVVPAYVRVTAANAGVIAFVNASAGAIDPADTFEFDVYLFKASGELAGSV